MIKLSNHNLMEEEYSLWRNKMAENRQKKRKISEGLSEVLDSHEVQRNEYNELAGAEKGVPVGGFWIPKGLVAFDADGQSHGAGKGKSIRVFNSTGAVLLVRTGVAGAATSFNGKVAVGFNSALALADSIAVPPGEYLLMNMGEDTHIKASATGLYFHELDDESRLVPRSSSELRS